MLEAFEKFGSIAAVAVFVVMALFNKRLINQRDVLCEKHHDLTDKIENVVSNDYPENKKTLLERFYIDIPGDSVTEFSELLDTTLLDEEITEPIDTILVKIDDLPVFGNYPITIEDFIFEQELADTLSSLENMDVLEKLYKRRYKEEWQLINAVNYINPFMGGEYAEFENYYGTRFMLGYKILWSEQLGEIEMSGTDLINLKDKILGVYVKLIDMVDDGRILLSHFMPIASPEILATNFLYNCFDRVRTQSQLLTAVEEQGVMSDTDNTVILNRRIERFKDYFMRNSSAYEVIYKTFATTNNADILKHYDLVYDLFDPAKKLVKNDVYYIMATHLINGWFEDGLTHLLVNSGYYVLEKLESLYSRFLLSEKYDINGDTTFLSPLLLEEWSANIKSFYDVDKIIYYIPMEKAIPDSNFVTPDLVSSESVAVEISQYYPILSYELKWFLLSLLDVQTGDYVFNRNFDLEEGGN